MRRDGTDKVKLIDWPGHQTRASYSADQTKIVFLSTTNLDGTPVNGGGSEVPYDQETGRQIFIANADGTGARQITPQRSTTASYYTGIGAPSFSPSGNEIAFHGYDSNIMVADREIFVMSASGGSTARRISYPVGGSSRVCAETSSGGRDPSWSPDGGSIIYEAAGTCKAVVRTSSSGDSAGQMLWNPNRGDSGYFGQPKYRTLGIAEPDPEPPAGKYVALGDSYTAGVGSGGAYEPGTDVENVNRCWRSSNAYPRLLAADGSVPSDLAFFACTGAKIADLSNTATRTDGPPYTTRAHSSPVWAQIPPWRPWASAATISASPMSWPAA